MAESASLSTARREYRKFSYKGAAFTIMTSGPAALKAYNAAVREIVRQREILNSYIRGHREFMDSLVPVKLPDFKNSPPVVKLMHAASLRTGIGPMASVAGVNAQLAAEAAVAAGAEEAVVENGGDIYLFARSEILIALYTGHAAAGSAGAGYLTAGAAGSAGAAGAVNSRFAFKIKPGATPLSVCSSSSRMGHSKSFGECDLATVVSTDGALADSAATLACNLVKTEEDIKPALDRITAIDKVLGILIIKNEKFGLAGALPELVKNEDPLTDLKVTRFGF